MPAPTRADALDSVVESQAFREGMALVAAAVNIITTVGADGPCGFTASAVSSVTDAPPTLLVCVNRSAQSHPAIVQSGVLCVNTVGPQDEALAMRFAGGVKDMAARFAGAAWSTAVTGSPVLDTAHVAFDCRLAGFHSIGTHDVLFGEVVAVRVRDNEAGLVYWRRSFHSLSDQGDGR